MSSPRPCTWAAAWCILGIALLSACDQAPEREVVTATQEAVSTTIFSSVPSGQTLGKPIWLSTIVFGTTSTQTRYRYRIGIAGDAAPAIVRDFSAEASFRWTPIDEGTYTIAVTVRGAGGGEFTTSRDFTILPRATTGPVVTSTLHPLVALYSAPPYLAGVADRVRVGFRPAGSSGPWTYTSWKRASPGLSTNIYVAGMKQRTTYELTHETDLDASPGPTPSSTIRTFRTGIALVPFPPRHVIVPPTAGLTSAEGVLLHALLFGDNLPPAPMATNLQGDVVWFYRRPLLIWNFGAMLTRPVDGGTMLLAETRLFKRGFLLREIDLAGNAVREVSVDSVNEQLAGFPIPPDKYGPDSIFVFHHEALRLPDGHTLALAGVEKQLDGAWVVGDMILDLDESWNVVWYWNSFDHLDVSRRLRGEACDTMLLIANVCGPITGSTAADWTHSNALVFVPEDGNLLLSMRHQDWVIKIDYRGNERDAGGVPPGDGHVVWRLGAGGDFQLAGALPPPERTWFSHQHQPEVRGHELVLFDNNNENCSSDYGTPLVSPCFSRGQVWTLDETANPMTASLTMSAPLGSYSSFLGSAQRLANGNYHFDSGAITENGESNPLPGYSEHVEIKPDGGSGQTVYRLGVDATTYRSFRMESLYAAPPTAAAVAE